jgi:hypothetical protein
MSGGTEMIGTGIIGDITKEIMTGDGGDGIADTSTPLL